MIDSLISLVPVIGGGLFGAIVKLYGISMEDRMYKEKALLETIQAKHKVNKDLNEFSLKSRSFNITRTIIALAVTSVLVGAFWFSSSTGVSIPIQSTSGGSYFWGLYDNKVTNIEYIEMQRVVLQDVLISFQFIIGTYFGANIASRKT